MKKKHFLNLNVSILKKHKNKIMFVCNHKKFFGNVIKPDQASQSRDTRPISLCGQCFESNCGGRGDPCIFIDMTVQRRAEQPVKT
jgi:hypothetical protein